MLLLKWKAHLVSQCYRLICKLPDLSLSKLFPRDWCFEFDQFICCQYLIPPTGDTWVQLHMLIWRKRYSVALSELLVFITFPMIMTK